MTAQVLITINIYIVILLLLSKPVGGYLTRAYQGEPNLLGRLFGPLTRLLQRFVGVPPGPGPLPAEAEMTWRTYVLYVLAWNGVGVLAASALGSAGATVRNFVSAQTALAVLSVVIRGLRRPGAEDVGNFWNDLIRGTFYVLLPLGLLLGLLLTFAGIVRALAESIVCVVRSF